jgi:hypothetical protein
VTFCVAAFAAVLSGSAALAHHSIANVYDGSRVQTLDGRVVRWEFVNPHPFITIRVEGQSTRPLEWRLEMDNRWELAELGFKADTLKPGDRIVVTGSLSRTEAQRLYVRRLDRPSDGFNYRHHD